MRKALAWWCASLCVGGLFAACATGGGFDDESDGEGAGAEGAGDPTGGGGTGGASETCADLPCSLNATCNDAGGEPVCTCNAGWEGTGETCTDVDECADAPCGAGECQNLPGTYACMCDPGFEEQGGTCVAVGECATDNGGCADGCTCAEVMGAPECTCTLTHSSTQVITSGNSVACTYMTGMEHAENSYYRVFDLAQFGVTGDLQVDTVEIGVELAQATTPPQPATIRLHRLTGAFNLANLTQITSSPVTIGNVGGAVLSFPVTGLAQAGSKLVVELLTPDAMGQGDLLYIGSNADAETDVSYMRAPTCGFAAPTTTAIVGFPNMHIVMNVIGTYVP